MIESFIKFAEELFPSISPYTKEEVKTSLKQFKEQGLEHNYCMISPITILTQGDVIGDLPFYRYNEETGDRALTRLKGILLSNTCDASRDPVLLFAPLLPLSEINIDLEAVKNNMVYRFLYIPDRGLTEFVVDMSLINSIPRVLVEKGLQSGAIDKIASLNSYGYYLLLTKLTIHLMRPEDREVQEDRRKGIAQ